MADKISGRVTHVRTAADRLASDVQGMVLWPGDSGYDTVRSAWNLNIDNRPRVIVAAIRPMDVAAAVRYAREGHLPVAVQGTGHGHAMAADDAVLVSTGGLSGLAVDPATRTARVGAGLSWRSVIDSAATYGLAPLNGSTSAVTAVAYITGGGLPVLGRTYGYAADRVGALELVTADGQLASATPEENPDLFWAVRGGMDNFGIVTSADLGLVAQPRFYGGGLFFPGASADVVLRRWIDWAGEQPDEMSTSVALMRFPDVPDIPEPVRGQFLVHVRIAYAGAPEEGRRRIRALRDLGPSMDTVDDRPYLDIDEVHQDPKQPMPVIDTCAMLDGLAAGFVQRLVDVAGVDADLPAGPVEIRRLGGALERAPATPNAIGHRDADFLLVLAMLNQPGESDAVENLQRGLLRQLEPWSTGASFPNFLGNHAEGVNVRAAYLKPDYERLQAIKAMYDPTNMFRINHNIPPEDDDSSGPRSTDR